MRCETNGDFCYTVFLRWARPGALDFNESKKGTTCEILEEPGTTYPVLAKSFTAVYVLCQSVSETATLTVRPVDASRAHAAVRVVRAAGGADGRTPAGVVVVGEAGAAEAVDGHDVAVGVAAPDVDGA